MFPLQLILTTVSPKWLARQDKSVKSRLFNAYVMVDLNRVKIANFIVIDQFRTSRSPTKNHQRTPQPLGDL